MNTNKKRATFALAGTVLLVSMSTLLLAVIVFRAATAGEEIGRLGENPVDQSVRSAPGPKQAVSDEISMVQTGSGSSDLPATIGYSVTLRPLSASTETLVSIITATVVSSVTHRVESMSYLDGSPKTGYLIISDGSSSLEEFNDGVSASVMVDAVDALGPRKFEYPESRISKLLDWQYPVVDIQYVNDLVASSIITAVSSISYSGRSATRFHLDAGELSFGEAGTADEYLISYDDETGLRISTIVTTTTGYERSLRPLTASFGISSSASVVDTTPSWDYVTTWTRTSPLDEHMDYYMLDGLMQSPTGTLSSGHSVQPAIFISDARRVAGLDPRGSWLVLQELQGTSGDDLIFIQAEWDCPYAPVQDMWPHVAVTSTNVAEYPGVLLSKVVVSTTNQSNMTLYTYDPAGQPPNQFQFLATWSLTDSVFAAAFGDWGFSDRLEFLATLDEFLTVADVISVSE